MKKDKTKNTKDTPAPSGVSLSQINVSKQKNRRALLLLLIIVLAGTAYGAYRTYVWYQDRTSTKKAGVQCSKQSAKGCDLVKEAVPLLDPKKVQELSKVVDKIKKIEGHEQDPDLLYVVTTYYINRSDAANARKYYDLLAEVYKPETGYDPLLGEQPLKPEDFKTTIEFLEQQNKLLEANFGGVPKDEQ